MGDRITEHVSHVNYLSWNVTCVKDADPHRNMNEFQKICITEHRELGQKLIFYKELVAPMLTRGRPR